MNSITVLLYFLPLISSRSFAKYVKVRVAYVGGHSGGVCWCNFNSYTIF